MPSRATHNKSRHGCLACKQRRKRCDLKTPNCTGCARRRIICVYEQTLHPVIVTSVFSRPIIRQLATEWDTVEPSVQAILLLEMPHVRFEDIEMIYSFMTRQPTTLDTMPGIFGVRHLDLPNIVPEYPYILYGLLTASVLHSKSSSRSRTQSSCPLLEEKATNFYQLALSTYRSRLKVIDEKTCHSIFAFSVTLAGLTLGLLCPRDSDWLGPCQTYADQITDVFDLLLGAVAVANESRAWIPDSLAEEPLMLPIRTFPCNNYELIEGEAHHALKSLLSESHTSYLLERSLHPQYPVDDISAFYESAIPELCNEFFNLQKPEPNDILGAIGWPAFVGRPFVSLLRQHHPVALAVLAHYGVALQALKHVWWLRGVGHRLIQSVAEIMKNQCGREWQTLLQWPMEKLKHPQLNTCPSNASRLFPPDYHSIETYSQNISRPFETALIITQMKGITGPYRKVNNGSTIEQSLV